MQDVAPVVVQLRGSLLLKVGLAVATYVVIGLPPSDAGARQVTVAVVGPVSKDTIVGAPGAEAAADDGADATMT